MFFNISDHNDTIRILWDNKDALLEKVSESTELS
jgi:hypothetical protein